MMAIDCCIDVSDAQASIDWNRVAAAGIKIAFVKGMEGSAMGYRTWLPQSQGAAAAGIMVIPYIFLRPTDDADTVITNFSQQAGLREGSRFALDWEGAADDTATAAAVEDIGLGLSAITKTRPIGYWGMPGSTPDYPTPTMETWDRWIPRYPQSPEPGSYSELSASAVARAPAGALFWQYTSCGTVDGIDGQVDRSVWTGTQEQLDAWCGGGGVIQEILNTIMPQPAQPAASVSISFPTSITAVQALVGVTADGIAGPNTKTAIGEYVLSRLA